jgi:hypothetical protein
MKTIRRRAAGGMIALTVGAGCAGQAQAPSGSEPSGYESPEKVEASIEQSLARINALQIVEIGRLVVDLPAEASSCYGPCPGWEPKIQAERARQAPRAEKLASIAERVAADSAPAPSEVPAAETARKALADLAIVEVGKLVEVKPANNPQCYNLPCASDVDAADRINRARVAQVLAVVDAAKRAGL